MRRIRPVSPWPRPVATAAAALLLAAATPAIAAADDAEPTLDDGKLTVEAFLEIPYLDAAVLADDGWTVAYRRVQRSIADDRKVAQIWMVDRDLGDPVQVTFDEGGVGAPVWRPGGGLSYRTGRGETTQVWLNPLDGTEPRVITALEHGAGPFFWSPDGQRLAVLARGADEQSCGCAGPCDGSCEHPAGEATGDEGDGDDAACSCAKDDGADEPPAGDFQVFDRLEQPAEYPQLWIVEVDGDRLSDAEPRQLTRAPLHAYHVAWSPDGERLALTYNERFSSLVDEEQRIALVDLETGELDTFTPADRHASLAAFSPDGTRVAYYRDRRAEGRAYLNVKDLVIRHVLSGDEQVVDTGDEIALGGVGPLPSYPPVWSNNARYLYVPGARGTSFGLYQIETRSGMAIPVVQERGNLRSLDVVDDIAVYVESELHRPGSLWFRKLRSAGGPVRLDSTDAAVADFDLRAPMKMSLPGADDDVRVEGFLFVPPGAEEAEDLPLIVEMHGGPFYRYGNAWTTRYPWHVLSHEGFAVFIANPRGGTGYGEAFQQAIYRGFGVDDFADLMAAIDKLVEMRSFDEDRLGFTGYSYGGLMTNVVVSRTSRFKAAVSIAGLWNYVSAMGQSNPQLLIDGYRHPWSDDLAKLWEDSPASRADHVVTPTLIMHGTEDLPVDPRQSIEMFTYLQLNDVPSRLVLYEGEGHGINRPVHMVDYESREIEWFRHYLLGDEEAEGAAEPVPVQRPGEVTLDGAPGSQAP